MQNQKINYDALLNKLIISESGKRVLLHSCCAPCASHCLSVLTNKVNVLNDDAKLNNNSQSKANKNENVDDTKGFSVTAFYYNPAIMPKTEYIKRGDSLKLLCEYFGVQYQEGEYDNDGFLQRIKGLENLPEGDKRCNLCFYDRLFATAIAAKQGGFDYFCTTLTVSPHKNSDLINNIGYEVAATTGVSYLPSDFKKGNGYLNSIRLSKQLGLYRQDYCGCIFSKRN